MIWVVGSQKIVRDREAGFKRIYEYSFPREDERAREAYGIGSGVNKALVVNRAFSRVESLSFWSSRSWASDSSVAKP